MPRHFIVFLLMLMANVSFGQVYVQTQSDAMQGLDRKAWAGLGNTTNHSYGYAHDFTLPARTNACEQITGISVVINLTGYTNSGGPCNHYTLYYNLFYGCGTYSGGATCLPATNLIAEPNFPPNTSPPPFTFGNPLGGPINPGLVPDFGGNLSVDVIPVSDPGCYPVAIGQISYQYTITVTVTVTENVPVTPALTAIGPFCATAAPTALNTTQSGITGSWMGTGVMGNSFDPAIAGAGSHTLTFIPDADQCANTNTITVVVNAPVLPSLTAIGPFCTSAAPTALNTTQSGITGTWSGLGVMGNSFNPATAGAGSHTLTFTPTAGQCASINTTTVTVNAPTPPALPSLGPFCISATPTALNTTQSGVTGAWSGPGVAGNSFNPATAGAGSHTLTFMPDAGQCASNNSTTITVNAAVTPALTAIGPFCASAAPTALNTTQGGFTGAWSGPGVSGNSFNPATAGAGSHTLTFMPDAGQCASSNTTTVTVNAPVIPALTAIGPFCASAASTALNTTQGGFTGAWSGPGVSGNSFNPATAGAGSHTLTFTPNAGQCASNNTTTVVVNAPVAPSLTAIGPFCASAAPTALNTTQSGVTGAWSGPGVSGNSFNPATAGAGSHTLTFTPDAGQCASNNTTTVVVDATVTPSLTAIGPFCANAAPTALNTTQSGITGAWSGPGVSGNSFNPATAGAGSQTLTFTPDAGQCANSNTTSVTVNPSPVANVPVPLEACILLAPPTLLSENSATVLSQITGGNPGLTVSWFFDAAATMPIPDINSILLANPPPTTVYASVSNGICAAATVPVGVVVLQPPVINAPSNVTACQSYTLPPITGTNLPGNEAYYTGPNGTGTQYFPGQAITATTTLFVYAGSGGCAGQEQFAITIEPPPVANSPAQPVQVCDNGTGIGQFNLTNLNGVISGGSGTVDWFSDPAGTIFIPNPGAYNSSSGTVYATVSNGNCTSPAVPVSLLVNPLPVVNLTVAQAISCTASANGAITTSIGGVVGPFSFDWNINTLDGQQNPTNLGPGTYSVVVTATTTGCMGTGSITLAAPTAITLNCAQQNPVSTLGGSDGSATVQISGGTAGYTVAWSGAASGSQMQATAGTATITGLVAGTYNILVTDANGCTQTCSFVINSPNCNLMATAVGSNPGCNGASSGSIALTVTGGTGALTFDWNINALDGTEDPTGLAAGTYAVTVTDGAGCTANTTVTLTHPAALGLVCGQQNPPSTIGGSDGSATVQISGGTAGYTVAWSGAASGSLMQAAAGTATITGLVAGTYNIVVTDANGCTQSCSFVINSPNCNLMATAVGSNPGCNGAASGSIALTVTGGTGALTFDWNNNTLDGTEDPTGLAAGTYAVTVTDGAGCTANTTVTLTDPAALGLACAQQNPPSTIGGSDGSATVQISGGTAGYTIAWSGAASGSQMQAAAGTATITGLVAGTYNIVVTDANGCTQSCSFVINSPNCNLMATAVGSNPGCNGASSGSIALTVTGGTGALTFDWNINTLDGTEDPTGLAAGTYAVTVTDGAGCTANTTVTLTDPAALGLACAQQNPPSTLGGSDGSATVQISGGTAGYTVAWSGAASGSQMQVAAGTATITGLVAGTYNIVVTDANGCTQSCSFVINSPNCNLMATAVGSNPGCNGAASGSIALTVTGGTGALTFDWDNNTLDGTEDPTGLAAGTYAVTVTDGAGCTANTTVTLTDPAALGLACAQQNPPSTIGGSDGSATVQVSGGTAGYTVAWSGAASGSQMQAAAGTATITGLVAGMYNILVTDANGCTQSCSFTIDSPNCNLMATAVGSNPACNGAASGSIALTVTGGIGALTFDWNINALDGTEDPTGLAAGTYTVTVTDAAGCTATTAVTLTDPAALGLVCGQQNPVSTLGGSDGSATVQISGGTAAYTVAWSGAASGSQMQAAAGTATITGLVAGMYNVVVTDANGCTQSCSFTIDSPNCNLSATAVGTNPGCNGASSGNIALTVTGGTGALTFDWNINALDGTEDPTGLAAGTYTVTVTDAAGCTATTAVTLTDPAALGLVCGQQNPVSTIGGSDGSATVQISGGTAAYTVAWSGAASGSQTQAVAGTATITGLIAGTYNILVTDANGCTQSCSFTINSPNCNLMATAVGSNPGCNGASSGSIALTVMGGTGALTFDWDNNTLDGTEDPTGLAAGTYTVTVTDAAGCTATTVVTLTDPEALAFAAEGIAANCLDPLNGSISITLASGGTAPYEVSFDGQFFTGLGSVPAQIAGVAPGNYTVTLQDANDCMVETQVVVLAAPTYTLDLGPNRTIRLGDSVRLEGLANFAIDSVVWTPTEFLNNVTGPVTFARPRVSTAYQLIAFAEDGCRVEDLIWVFVEQKYEIFVPNAFSPNGDGVNDKFRIFGDDKIKIIRNLQIFDRWGGNVFGIANVAPDDNAAGWNGSHRGQPVSAGVYLYFAEIEFFDDHVETVKGEVTVVR